MTKKYSPVTPIKKTVGYGMICHAGQGYLDKALAPYNGKTVLCDLEKDVDTDESSFGVYDAATGERICTIRLGGR